MHAEKIKTKIIQKIIRKKLKQTLKSEKKRKQPSMTNQEGGSLETLGKTFVDSKNLHDNKCYNTL